MFEKQGLSSERVLDHVLHASGALGLAAIVSVGCWRAAAGLRESPPAHPSSGPGTQVAHLRTLHGQLDELDKQLKTVEARLQDASRRIPPEPRDSAFLKDLMRIASETSLTIRDYQPAPPNVQGGCRQMLIRLSGSGDYRGICRFLDGVGRLPRLTTVETLEISADSAAAAYPFAMTVAVYFTDRGRAVGMKGTDKNG